MALCCARSLALSSDLAVTALHIAALAEKRASGIPGFVPKQSFRLRLPRTRRGARSRTHHIRIVGGTATIVEPSSSPASIGDDRHLLSRSTPDAPVSTDASDCDDSNDSQAQESEPWFLDKWPAFDPNWMWYTSDRPILGFTGAF